MRVIGTAGHVDHGKSTLVKVLTGIDPDRLAEEQARQMTIDLGFAFMQLGGQTVGIVDVPGHRDFIENMLAGVGGIDAVLLVIAADEGIMPQTREHLAILQLLSVTHGIVVLTKTDAVGDPEWISLIQQDVRAQLITTPFADAPILRVSAHTGEGLPSLKHAISELLDQLPPRKATRSPRLPIDRVFSLSGFGTVVTGTLLDGSLRQGDEVALLPSNRRSRVRSLQSYHQPVEIAAAGSRVAVNIAGIDRSEIGRGEVLIVPGAFTETTLVDVVYEHLRDAQRPLHHNTLVKVFAGTAEYAARIRLLFDDHIMPGNEGFAQLMFEREAVLADGDRFVIRLPSPPETIGGGFVVDAHPARRWRRRDHALRTRLESRVTDEPHVRLAQLAHGAHPVKREELRQRSAMTEGEFDNVLKMALDAHLIVSLSDGYLHSDSFAQLNEKSVSILAKFHAENPMRLGMPREEFRSRIAVRPSLLTDLSQVSNRIVIDGPVVRLPEHAIRFTDDQQELISSLLDEVRQAGFSPPSVSEILKRISEEEYHALLALGHLILIGADIVLEKSVYKRLIDSVVDLLNREDSITAAAVRDYLNTSRKFAIAYLEHLDTVGVTRRLGDARMRGPRAG